MLYTLNELLIKMGAPETKEKGSLRWHYFDSAQADIGGFAEVRLVDGGGALVAELKHLRHDREDDFGNVHPFFAESFYMHAKKVGAHYKVTKVAFDGEDYTDPQRSIIELGLSIFHARALDISILMVEQAFNRQDIVQPVTNQNVLCRKDVQAVFRQDAWGVVVPFRPRQQSRVSI